MKSDSSHTRFPISSELGMLLNIFSLPLHEQGELRQQGLCGLTATLETWEAWFYQKQRELLLSEPELLLPEPELLLPGKVKHLSTEHPGTFGLLAWKLNLLKCPECKEEQPELSRV
ncbi:UNVERIFIED_CONTAM: hypothetical protein FKN15_029505 [Acipenser sinensis]